MSLVSDIGTKPLTSTRIRFLKEEMNMWLKNLENEEVVQSREADGERAGDEVKSYEGIQVGNAAKALKLITMAAMIQV